MEQIGSEERNIAIFKNFDEACKTAEEIRKKTSVIVEIREYERMRLYSYKVKPYAVIIDGKEYWIEDEVWIGKGIEDEEEAEMAVFSENSLSGTAMVNKKMIEERCFDIKEIA